MIFHHVSVTYHTQKREIQVQLIYWGNPYSQSVQANGQNPISQSKTRMTTGTGSKQEQKCEDIKQGLRDKH